MTQQQKQKPQSKYAHTSHRKTVGYQLVLKPNSPSLHVESLTQAGAGLARILNGVQTSRINPKHVRIILPNGIRLNIAAAHILCS